MLQYIIRRFFSLFPILFGVSVIVFVLMRMIPGDIATMILMGGGEGGASLEAIAELKQKLGLNDPLHVQYVKWIGGMIRFDAGNSLWSDRPVFDEIRQRLPLTAQLAIMAISTSVTIAIPIGVLSALKQDTWVDYLFRVLAIGGLALPNFWTATLCILFLTLWFNWSPPLGWTPLMTDPLVNLQQMIWPALVLGYSTSAVVSRMTRSAMLEVLREDYIRTAWAKGLGLWSITFRHALRNAVLPVITISAMQFGSLLGGTVIMETIFTLPGDGRYLVDAIFHRDYPVVQCLVVMMGTVFVMLNLTVDVLYGWLDPRIRYS